MAKATTLWRQTYTGIKFYLANPTPDMIRIEDIAHALSLQCRFSGHTREFYSVAQHCLHVSRKVPYKKNGNAFAGLMHDAAEAYLGDVCPAVKILCTKWDRMEAGILRAISRRFNVDFAAHAGDVLIADAYALAKEKRDLLTPMDWGHTMPDVDEFVLAGCTPQKAERDFLIRFYQLDRDNRGRIAQSK